VGKNEEGRGMSKELIERLRADAESTDDIGLCADAAERIEELERERDAFYMDYRMKCDEQTKSLCVERDALRQQLDTVSEEFGLPKGTGPAPGEIKRILSDLRQQIEEARGLLEDCSGWLHADHTAERSLLRKIGEFLK